MKLHLACGGIRKDGWVNVDISSQVSPDVTLDLLTFPWPWENDSADEIYCSHFIEHIGDEFFPFFDECYRVLKSGGKAEFLCPYYTSVRAWQDPTHKRAISEVTFNYLSAPWRARNGIGHYPVNCDFKVEQVAYHCTEDWRERPQDEFDWARVHCWNVVMDIQVRLTK